MSVRLLECIRDCLLLMLVSYYLFLLDLELVVLEHLLFVLTLISILIVLLLLLLLVVSLVILVLIALSIKGDIFGGI